MELEPNDKEIIDEKNQGCRRAETSKTLLPLRELFHVFGKIFTRPDVDKYNAIHYFIWTW